LAIALVTRHSLNVDNPLLAEDAGDLSLTRSGVSADDLDLVILADGQGSDGVFSLQFLGERSGHDDPTLVGRSVEVRLAARSAAAGHGAGKLHFDYSFWLYPKFRKSRIRQSLVFSLFLDDIENWWKFEERRKLKRRWSDLVFTVDRLLLMPCSNLDTKS